MAQRKLALLLLLGCGTRAAPMPQVPVKEHYAMAHAARVDDGHAVYVLHPAPDAERLLKVQAHAAASSWHATFYTDGTLQAEAHEHEGLMQRSSAQLSAEELRRLHADMPALELCRRNAAARIREDELDAPHVVFEVYAGPMRGQFVEHVKGARAPSEFQHYEAFVLGLVEQTLRGNSD